MNEKEVKVHTCSYDGDQGMNVHNAIYDQIQYYEGKGMHPAVIILSEDTARELQALLWEVHEIFPSRNEVAEFMGIEIIVDARPIMGRIEVIATRNPRKK